MEDIVTLKVKKKYGKKHNKKVKYISEKYDEKLCEELKSKLNVFQKKLYYGFIPFYNKFPKEESKASDEPIYLNISYFFVRDRHFFKIIEKNDEYSLLQSFFKLFPEMEQTNLKEKYFIPIGIDDNIELYLVRFQPILLSKGLLFSHVPPIRTDIFAWQSYIDFYSNIKNSKKKIYKQILENDDSMNNYHLNIKFYPDLEIQQKEVLNGVSLEYIYRQIIGEDTSDKNSKPPINNFVLHL